MIYEIVRWKLKHHMRSDEIEIEQIGLDDAMHEEIREYIIR